MTQRNSEAIDLNARTTADARIRTTIRICVGAVIEQDGTTPGIENNRAMTAAAVTTVATVRLYIRRIIERNTTRGPRGIAQTN